MTCNASRHAPPRCHCGGTTMLDDWVNYKNNLKLEVFVRCMSCGALGPSAEDNAAAEQLWLEYLETKR